MKSLIGLLLPLCALNASVINFSSQGSAADSGEWNNLGATLAIPAPSNNAWAAALPGSVWVSFAQTGDWISPGYQSPANGTVVSFFQTLTLPWVPTIAEITYRADDAVAFYINGVLVLAEAPQLDNTYNRCSDVPVGCLDTTDITLNIASYLVAGVNTFRFDVAQRGGYSFGLNYAGFAEGTTRVPDPDPDPTPTPEPITFALVGVALLGAGLFRRGSAR